MSALLYGLNAGLSFSPHTLGMIMTSLGQGRKKGLYFMLGALHFDLCLVIVILSYFQKIHFPNNFQLIMQLTSGLLVIRMGYKSFLAKPKLDIKQSQSKSSWMEGFLIQAFNPNPYLFWFFIGAPTVLNLKSWSSSIQFIGLFLGTLYFLKTIILEISSRISTDRLIESKTAIYLRKSISVLTMINGLYLMLKISL
ncbi:MAG: LysE family transporter [Bacteriovoracaceae bacterium]